MTSQLFKPGEQPVGLSLIQPWASLCVLVNASGRAEKEYETRDWEWSLGAQSKRKGRVYTYLRKNWRLETLNPVASLFDCHNLSRSAIDSCCVRAR